IGVALTIATERALRTSDLANFLGSARLINLVTFLIILVPFYHGAVRQRLLAHLHRWHRMDAELGVPHVCHYQGSKVTKLRRSWVTARKAAGLSEDVIPHTLRHTAATWLMQGACDMWEAAGYLGMTVETLEEVYGHHHPDHQKGIENAQRRSQRVTRNTRTQNELKGNRRAERR